MRRLRDRPRVGLFRGGELPRLMTMIVMLGVLAMMMRRAQDQDTWRFFTGEPRPNSQDEPDQASPQQRERPRRKFARASQPNNHRLLVQSDLQAAQPTNSPSSGSSSTAAQPTAAQPTEAQPTEAQPTEAQPTEAQPTEAQPTEAQPTEAQPTAAQPTEAQPTEAQPTEAQSIVESASAADAPPTMAGAAAAEETRAPAVSPDAIAATEGTTAPTEVSPDQGTSQTGSPQAVGPETADPQTSTPEESAPANPTDAVAAVDQNHPGQPAAGNESPAIAPASEPPGGKEILVAEPAPAAEQGSANAEASDAAAPSNQESAAGPSEKPTPPQTERGEDAARTAADATANSTESGGSSATGTEPLAPPQPLDRPNRPAVPDKVLVPGEAVEAEANPNEPLDESPDEQRAFEREASVITDNVPISEVDMFAYNRLLRWQYSQTAEQLRARARADVSFNDLLEQPEEHRGELLRLRLHLRQNIALDASPDMPIPVSKYYQAVGWNDASQAWFYFCIYTELPTGMPIGPQILEEGTFVGYFLKNLTYRDGKGTRIKAPVLIGRMMFHPTPPRERNTDEWRWSWLGIGVLLVLGGLRWVWRLTRGIAPSAKSGRSILPPLPPRNEEGEEIDIERWLEQVEEAAPAALSEIKADVRHELNGGSHWDGAADRPDRGLPDHGLNGGADHRSIGGSDHGLNGGADRGLD